MALSSWCWMAPIIASPSTSPPGDAGQPLRHHKGLTPAHHGDELGTQAPKGQGIFGPAQEDLAIGRLGFASAIAADQAKGAHVEVFDVEAAGLSIEGLGGGRGSRGGSGREPRGVPPHGSMGCDQDGRKPCAARSRSRFVGRQPGPRPGRFPSGVVPDGQDQEAREHQTR